MVLTQWETLCGLFFAFFEKIVVPILTSGGKVKTIIVKDFSRFARDYIEAGDYMERIFPLLGVRFISVNDGYDSGIQIRNDVCGLEVAIKNIINASYSRDLSAKIAAADHVMQKKGMYLGGYRPFGFLPDPNDCHKLILDPVASQYVRLIFELALQGNRTGTIAKILNEKQIPTSGSVSRGGKSCVQRAESMGLAAQPLDKRDGLSCSEK
jgi:DNA invertase Pin-like site-specific DNA recombinase